MSELSKTKVISIYSSKGGVGKTTSCANIGVALGKINIKVLVIDIDPIANLSSTFLYNEINDSFLLFCKNFNNKNIKKNVSNNVDLIPSSLDLSFKFDEAKFNEYKTNLINNLNQLKKSYDVILIDLSSNFNSLNKLILAISDSILIPLSCNQYTLDSISKTLSIIRKIQSEYNNNLRIEGAFINQFDARLSNSVYYMSEISKIFNSDLYDTVIPQDTSINKLQKDNKTVVKSAAWKPSGIKFSELANEIYKKIVKKSRG